MLNSKTRRLTFLVLLSVFVVTIFALGSDGHAAPESTDAINNPFVAYTPVVVRLPKPTNCRYGVGNEPNKPANQWMDHMGAGHYVNFVSKPWGPPVADSVELYRQVRLQQDKDNGVYLPSFSVDPPLNNGPNGLGKLVQENPNVVWMVGNEPDVANAHQDDMFPEIYARAYHDVYYFIKQIDPHARVANAGLSMMTPGRLQYMDIVWNTYVQLYAEPMPVDLWNMHLYILSEIRPWDNGPSDGKVALGTDPALAKRAPDGPANIECPKEDVYCRAEHDNMDIFAEQIVAMRTWMKSHGQQDKPLILSEFSQLYPFVDYDDPVNPTECFLMDEFGNCFTQNRVSTFLTNAMDYLENAKDPNLGNSLDDNRLVQQWSWYSMWIDAEFSGGSSNLLVDGYETHQVGSASSLTQVGHTYRNRVLNEVTTVNILAAEASDVQAQVAGPGATADVELKVGYMNTGTGVIYDSFTVTFYADPVLTQVIGETIVVPGETGMINGCSWGHITDWASFTWTGVPEGIHSYWVKVDSNNDIFAETNEADNVISGQVTVTQ
ncbi:MAG: hypothetical protein R3293_13290 [Candidatus Promineifilaceae bacterium]|nr:hypothetical protein [Candidatus Promineifilaceae bacterium]